MKKLLSLGLVLFTLVVLAACNDTASVAASTVAIDVNPSVVLELDDDDVVINVILNNEDAEIIVGDMNLIGVDYDVAINALIGSMVANGYISDIANSILLSIQNEDEVRESELMVELAEMINEVLTGSEIEGSVIVQDLEFEDDAEELAEQLGISEAKAELILDIIEVDPRMTVEELAELSINDLNLLLEAKNIVLDDVEKTGEASELGIITVEEAYHAALAELGIDEAAVVELEVELEQEDGVMVYEVEIDTESEEYEILIDAKEGTVYVEVDDDHEDDEEDDEDEYDEFPVDALTQEQIMELIATALELDPTMIELDEFEEEFENGIGYYEVEFYYEGVEYELEVDAVSGAIYTNSMDEDGFDYDDDEYDDDDDEYDDEDDEYDDEYDDDDDEYEDDDDSEETVTEETETVEETDTESGATEGAPTE